MCQQDVKFKSVACDMSTNVAVSIDWEYLDPQPEPSHGRFLINEGVLIRIRLMLLLEDL